ncbi:MAG: hypothetical protein ACLRPX_08270 [Ruthenibacterium sp.]
MAPGFAGEAITLGGTLENTPAAGRAPARSGGAASAQVLATWQGGLGTGRPEEASVAIDEWLSSFSRTLYWVDNHNEAALRPDTAQYPQPILKFRLDGTGEFVQLTQENMAQLGLQQMPQAAVSQAGVGSYLVTVGDHTLPVKYTEIDPYGDETQHTVEWQIEPAACGAMPFRRWSRKSCLNSPVSGKAGWYYAANRPYLRCSPALGHAGQRARHQPGHCRAFCPHRPDGAGIQPVSAGRFGRRSRH